MQAVLCDKWVSLVDGIHVNQLYPLLGLYWLIKLTTHVSLMFTADSHKQNLSLCYDLNEVRGG
jgi:hypothetical protein